MRSFAPSSSRPPVRRCEVIGLEDSFDGLIESNRWRRLTPRDVTGILRIGGTILGTANRGNPFAVPVQTSSGARSYSERCVEIFHELTLDALIVIGGDRTLAIAHEFHKLGIPLVGVPKTIDNDIVETTNTFGFDTAVSFATDAIDRLHTTAEAHHRVMVVEVMGRNTGWIALYAGVAGGADVILIPEIPYDLDKVAARIRARDALGARFSIVVVAEGARPVGGSVSIVRAADGDNSERLGGVAAKNYSGARNADRQGGARGGAGSLAAWRVADQLRPHPGDTIRRPCRRIRHGRDIRQHGRIPAARHRRGAARSDGRPNANRAARFRPPSHCARDGHLTR